MVALQVFLYLWIQLIPIEGTELSDLVTICGKRPGDILRLDTVRFEGDADLDGGDDDDVLLIDGPVEFDESRRVEDFEFGD